MKAILFWILIGLIVIAAEDWRAPRQVSGFGDICPTCLSGVNKDLRQ